MSKGSVLYKNIGVQTKGVNIGVVGSSGNIGDLLLGILDDYSEASLIKAFDLVPPKRTVSKRVKVYSGNDGDVTSFEAVRKFISDLDFVACAIGARSSKIFEVETGGMKNLVKASKETGGVKQILYISVLGVGKKLYDFQVTQKAKKEAEQNMIDSGIAYTIFRPSGYIFDFHRGFSGQVKQGIFSIVDGHDTKGQPIGAQNVAEIMAAAIGNPKAYNQIFNLGGKEVFRRSDFAKLYTRLLGQQIELRSLTTEKFREMYKDAPFDINVLLHMMKTDSVLEPGDLEKLKKTFPGIEELFIDYETKVKKLLKEQTKQ